MNALKKAKTFLLSREAQRGQMLLIWAAVLLAILILGGLVIDVARMVVLERFFTELNLATACVAGVEANRRGGDAQAAFAASMTKNGMEASRYIPKEGTGKDLTRGFEYQGNLSWMAAASYRAPTSFLALVGWSDFPVLARVRCVGRDTGGLAPIAVRYSAVMNSLEGNPPDEYTILGRDPKWDLADVESGTNFRGAVFLHMWCVPSTDPNCPDIRVFYPLTEEPPSASTQKKLVEDCFKGINCNIWPGVSQRLPIVSGTSDAQICHAFQEGGWKVGDKVVVIVFDGEVYSPDPTYGNWENVAVVGYAVYEIRQFLPTEKNCNHVTAHLVGGIYNSLDEIPNDIALLKSREISVYYEGAIPWK